MVRAAARICACLSGQACWASKDHTAVSAKEELQAFTSDFYADCNCAGTHAATTFVPILAEILKGPITVDAVKLSAIYLP